MIVLPKVVRVVVVMVEAIMDQQPTPMVRMLPVMVVVVEVAVMIVQDQEQVVQVVLV